MMQAGEFKFVPEFTIPMGPTPALPDGIEFRTVLSVRLEPIPGSQEGFDDSGEFLGIWSGEDDLVAAAIGRLKDKRANAKRVGVGHAGTEVNGHDLNVIHEQVSSSAAAQDPMMAERGAAGNAGRTPEASDKGQAA